MLYEKPLIPNHLKGVTRTARQNVCTMTHMHKKTQNKTRKGGKEKRTQKVHVILLEHETRENYFAAVHSQ